MLIIIFGSVILSMGIMLLAIILGPTIFDRIMSVNCFTNYTIVFIAMLSAFKGKETFIDIALVYALINFIATIAFLKYFKNRIQ